MSLWVKKQDVVVVKTADVIQHLIEKKILKALLYEILR